MYLIFNDTTQEVKRKSAKELKSFFEHKNYLSYEISFTGINHQVNRFSIPYEDIILVCLMDVKTKFLYGIVDARYANIAHRYTQKNTTTYIQEIKNFNGLYTNISTYIRNTEIRKILTCI